METKTTSMTADHRQASEAVNLGANTYIKKFGSNESLKLSNGENFSSLRDNLC
jgi:hypothetical protein